MNEDRFCAALKAASKADLVDFVRQELRATSASTLELITYHRKAKALQAKMLAAHNEMKARCSTDPAWWAANKRWESASRALGKLRP